MYTFFRYVRHLLVLFLLFISSLAVAAQPLPKDLSGFVKRGMDLWHVPGMAVGVVSKEKTLFMQGFGKTATLNGKPVDEHTLFAICSDTKNMVDAGVMILVDEGKLSLDDPVSKYLPEVHFSNPMLTEQVTVRDLMTHRTGLPRTDFWSYFYAMPLKEQFKHLAWVKPQAGLRSRFIYNNTMYGMLGEIIQRVSGQRWDHFLREHLWHPIGMNETFGYRGEIPKGYSRVTPYYYLNGKLHKADWDLPDDFVDSSGSVWSNVHDLALWAQFMLRGGVTANGKRLLSKKSFKTIFTPQMLIARADFHPTAELTKPHWTSYGLGWFQEDFQGRQIDYHTGSLTGFSAIIGLDREQGRGVVALINLSSAELRHALLWEVMDNRPANARIDWNGKVFDLYEKRHKQQEAQWQVLQKKRLPSTKPSLPLDRYTGRYESPAIGKLTITRSGNTLHLVSSRHNLPLSHWHLDTFVTEYLPATREFLKFKIEPDGTVSGFEGFGETFKRIGD